MSADTTPATTDQRGASEPRHKVDPPTPPQTAKDPRGFARVAVFGVLWSLALVALAVVAGHDALAYWGLISGTPWIESALTYADGLPPQFSWVVVAVVAGLVGLVLVYVALRPRPHLGTPVRAQTGVFLLDRGLRRLAAATAEDVDGVDTAKASISGRRVTVTVHGLSADRDPDLEGRVKQQLEGRLEALENAPRLRVRDQGSG